MPRKKDTPDKKIRQVVIAPAAQLSAEEQARLQQLMNERQALSDQLAVISSEAFNIAPRLYEASSSLNEFNTILSNSAKNNKRLQLQMERLESNQLTGEDQAEFISLIEKQQQQLLSDKSALLDQFQTRPETLDKEGVASFEEKISFLEQTIISVRNNTVSTQQRQQIALLLFPIQNRLLQQAISDIQPPFNHLKSLEKIPATVIIRTAHELYAQVKTHIEQLRNRVGESTASSDLKRTIQETDNAILQFEQAMTQFLKAQERIQTSEKAGNDDHIRLANIHWQLQQKSFEIRQGIKLIDDKLILENKDAAISKAQGLANTKQRQLRQTLNIIQLYPIRSPFIQEIKHLLANFENSEEIITLDVQLTSTDELQWHNRSELVPGLLIQRDTQLTVLQQQLKKVDQALSNVAQAIETEKQRLLPFQQPLHQSAAKQALLVQLGILKERKSLLRSFNLILSLDYLNLPPEHLVTSLSDITNLYRWGDPLSEINKFINRMEAETAAARQNFINNYPEFNSGSDFLEYRGKRYNREEMISLLIKHSDFLKRLPPFKTANSDIKGLIATGDTGELRNYIDVHCRDYLDAYTRLSTAFQNGANEQIDYPSLLQALSKIKPALDSITELADKAQEHERIIIQREKEAAAAREAEQERQRQRQLSIQHTVEMLSAQLKRQLYKNMTLAQQVKEIIYKLEGEEQRVGQDKDDPRITTLRAISQEIFLPFEIKLQALNQLIVRSSEHLTVDTMEETKADLLRYVQETNQLVSSIPRQMTEQLSDKNLEALSLKKQNAFLRFIDQWLIRPFLSKRSDSFFATKMEKNLHGFREMFQPQNQIDPTPEGEIEDIKIPQRN